MHAYRHKKLGNQCFPICGPSIKAGINSEGTKHEINEAPFYFSERQTMPRCFGQYVQKQLPVNKRLYNSLDSVSPWRELLLSEYLFFEHTTATSLLQLIASKSIGQLSLKNVHLSRCELVSFHWIVCYFFRLASLDPELIMWLLWGGCIHECC